MKKWCLAVIFLVGTQSWQGLKAQEVEELISAPYREVSLIATPEGFYPQRITVFEGEKIKFFVTSTGVSPNCFIINEKNIFLSAQSGKVSEGEAYFEASGVLKYSCPSTKIEGKIVVMPKKKKVERKVASTKNRPKLWRPKDFPDEWKEEEK